MACSPCEQKRLEAEKKLAEARAAQAQIKQQPQPTTHVPVRDERTGGFFK